MALAHRIHDYTNPRSIGSEFRARRAKRLVSLIEAISQQTGQCRIIDLGGAEDYWNAVGHDFLQSRNCTILLVNTRQLTVTRSSVFRHVLADACATGFPDRSFDLVHSNSTIEHVGTWGRMKVFAGEVRRLASTYFVQTPNFWFPWEPHFGVPGWQFLPVPLRVSLMRVRSWGFHRRAETIDDAVSAVESCYLLDRQMFAWLFPDAEMIIERFLGLPKSLVAVRAAGERGA